MLAAAAGLLAALASARAASVKLDIGPSSVLDMFSVSAMGTPATNLADEQQAAGDPRSGNGGNVSTPWNPIWQPSWYAYTPRPAASIDLGAEFELEAVWFAHGWGQLQFNISLASSSPLQPTSSVVVHVGKTNPTCGPLCWANVSLVGAKARYIVVSLPQTPGDSLYELVAYGTPTGAAAGPPAAVVTLPERPAPLLGAFFGANIVGAVSGIANLSAVSHARMYFDWGWGEAAAGENAFEPTDDVDFFMDDYLAAAAAAGVPVHTAVQGTAPFVHGGNASEAKWKPLTLAQMLTPGASEDPASYGAYASHAFQWAARYGARSVPASLLRLKQGQPPRSGLGTLAAFEAGNEWSATWNGREGYFSPLEYAAFLSAAYDGHEGSMGAGMGVRAADPTMAVSNAGLAELANCSIDYLETMWLWAAAHRKDARLPLDILSFHHYCNAANGPVPAGPAGDAAEAGISPEADSLAERVGAYVAWARRRAPDARVWLGEFGWDTFGGPQAAPAIGNLTAESVQAAWLVRAALAAAEGGADGAQMYMMADVNSKAPYRFSSSGLLSDKASGFRPKPSFFAYSAVVHAAGGLPYCGRRDDRAAGVAVAVLGRPGAGCGDAPGGLVVWSPTASDRRVASYALDVGAGARGPVVVMRLADGAPRGVNATVPLHGTTAVVAVDETPAFVFL